jgi:hypothetical protein
MKVSLGRPFWPCPGEFPRLYEAGTPIDMTASGDGYRYAGTGWSYPEAKGTWTEGPSAVLTLRLLPPRVGAEGLRADVSMRGLVGPSRPELTVTVLANGQEVGTAAYRLGLATPETLSFRIPKQALRADGVLELAFRPSDSAPVHNFGFGDGMRIAAFLERLSLAWP